MEYIDDSAGLFSASFDVLRIGILLKLRIPSTLPACMIYPEPACTVSLTSTVTIGSWLTLGSLRVSVESNPLSNTQNSWVGYSAGCRLISLAITTVKLVKRSPYTVPHRRASLHQTPSNFIKLHQTPSNPIKPTLNTTLYRSLSEAQSS